MEDEGFVIIHHDDAKEIETKENADDVVVVTADEIVAGGKALGVQPNAEEGGSAQFLACVTNILSKRSFAKCTEIDFRAGTNRYAVLDDDSIDVERAAHYDSAQTLLAMFPEVFQGLPYQPKKKKTSRKKSKQTREQQEKPTGEQITVDECVDAVSALVSSGDDEEDTEPYSEYDYHIQRKNPLHAQATYSLILLLRRLAPGITTLRLDGYPVCQRTLCLLLSPNTFPSLTRLSLASSSCLNFFSELAGVTHPHLTELNMSSWLHRDHVEQQSMQECNMLAIVAACPKLQRLRVSGSWVRLSHKLLTQIGAHCQELQKLTMSMNLEGDGRGELSLSLKGIETLLSGCPNFAEFNTRASGIADKAVALLLQSPNMRRLHLLGGGGETLEGNSRRRGKRAASAPSTTVNPPVVTAPAKLEHIYLSGPDLVSATLVQQHLAPLLASAPKLRLLDLRWGQSKHAAISVALTELLQACELAALETISFCASAGVQKAIWAGLRQNKFPNLRTIQQWGHVTGDEERSGDKEVVADGDAWTWQEIAGFKSGVTELHLCGPLLTPEFFGTLAESFPQLTALHLSGYHLPELSQEALNSLLSAFLKLDRLTSLNLIDQQNMKFDWFSVPILRAVYESPLQRRLFPTQLVLPEKIKLTSGMPDKATKMVELLDNLQEDVLDVMTHDFAKQIAEQALAQFVQQGSLPAWMLRDVNAEEQKSLDIGADSDEDEPNDPQKPLVEQFHSLVRQLRRSSKKTTTLTIPGLLPSIINPYLRGAAQSFSFVVDENILRTAFDALEHNRVVTEINISVPQIGLGSENSPTAWLSRMLPVMPRLGEVLGTLSGLTNLKIVGLEADVVVQLLSQVKSPVLSVVEVTVPTMNDSVVMAIASLIESHANTLRSVTFGPPQHTHDAAWGVNAVIALQRALSVPGDSKAFTLAYSGQTRPATTTALVKGLIVGKPTFLNTYYNNNTGNIKPTTDDVFMLLEAFIANQGKLVFAYTTLNITGEHVLYEFQSQSPKFANAAAILAQVKSRGFFETNRDTLAQVFLSYDPTNYALDMQGLTGDMNKAVEAWERACSVLMQVQRAVQQATHPTWRQFYGTPAKGELVFVDPTKLDDEIKPSTEPPTTLNADALLTEAGLTQSLVTTPTTACSFANTSCTRRSWVLPGPSVTWLNEADITFGGHSTPLYLGELKTFPSDKVALASLLSSRPDITPQMMETVTPQQIRVQCRSQPSFLLSFALSSPTKTVSLPLLEMKHASLLHDGGASLYLKFLEDKERGLSPAPVVVPPPKALCAAYQVSLADSPAMRVVWCEEKKLVVGDATTLKPILTATLTGDLTAIIVIKGVAVVLAGKHISVFHLEEAERNKLSEVQAFASMKLAGEIWTLGWCGDFSIFYGKKAEVVELVLEGNTLRQNGTLSVANKREMDKPVVMSIGVSQSTLVAATLGTFQIFTRATKARTALLEYSGVMGNARMCGEVAVVVRSRPRKTRQLQWQGTGEPCVEFIDTTTGKSVATIVALDHMTGCLWDRPNNKLLVSGNSALLELTLNAGGAEEKQAAAAEETKDEVRRTLTTSAEMEELRTSVQNVLEKGKKKPGERLEAILGFAAKAANDQLRTELLTFAFARACELQMTVVAAQLLSSPLDFNLEVPPFGSGYRRQRQTRWCVELAKQITSEDDNLAATPLGAAIKLPAVALALLELPNCPPVKWPVLMYAVASLSEGGMMFSFDTSAETKKSIGEWDKLFCRLLTVLQPSALQLSEHSLATLADASGTFTLSATSQLIATLIADKCKQETNPQLRLYQQLKRAVELAMGLISSESAGLDAAIADVQRILNEGADPDGHVNIPSQAPKVEVGAALPQKHQIAELVNHAVWRDYPPTLLCLVCNEENPPQVGQDTGVQARGQLIAMLLRGGADPNRPGLIKGRVQLPIDLLFAPELFRLFVKNASTSPKGPLDLSRSSCLNRLTWGTWVGCVMNSSVASWNPLAERAGLAQLLLEHKASPTTPVAGGVPVDCVRKEAQLAADRLRDLRPDQAYQKSLYEHMVQSMQDLLALYTR